MDGKFFKLLRECNYAMSCEKLNCNASMFVFALSHLCSLALLLFVAFGLSGCLGGDSANAEDEYVQSDSNSSLTNSEYKNNKKPNEYGIVYVRIPRSHTIDHFKRTDRSFDNVEIGDPFDPSFADTLPEVSRILSGFNAGGQLIWQHKDGTQTIIFDCKNGMPAEGVVPPLHDGDDVCQPLDPVISFDGKKLAFSVYHGKADKHRTIGSHNTGQVWRLMKPTWAGIYIYNFETRKLTHWHHKKGVWDTAPVWLPDGKMMFTSTRENVYVRHTFPLSESRRGIPISQLWISNRDGTDAINVGTQAQDNVLHPIIHSSGRVLFSIHELPFARYWDRYGFNNAEGEATKGNVWWIDSVDLRGGDLVGHLGTHNFHGKKFTDTFGRHFDMSIEATHFLGELSNGDICVDVYYRAQNTGGGRIICWPATNTSHTPLGHEGPYPMGLPKGAYVAVNGQHVDEAGPKVRDPAGLPDGKILYAGAFGSCRWPFPKGHMSKIVNYTKALLEGRSGGKTCDYGIYKQQPLGTAWNPSKDGSRHREAVEIVNSPKWHEIMPRAVLPYKAIYGISEPKQPSLLHTPNNDQTYGIFASVNAYKANLRTQYGWNGPKDGRWCHFQGCALQSPLFLNHQEGEDYDVLNSRELKYIRFWRVVPLDHPVARGVNHGRTVAELWGQKVVLMGDVPIQPDGSFKAKLPADVPFLMAGVDEQGRSIARHQHVMAMRPGEKQVCAGCHLHATSDDENSQYPFNATMAASKPPVSPKIRWQNSNPQPEWKTDIYPMLKDKCSSCHDGSNGHPAPNFNESRKQLYVDLTNYNAGRPKWPKSVYPSGGRTESGDKAAVPWLSRYINGLFSRESLLYWKAAGERLDGRTDEARDDDFDFGDYPDSVHSQKSVLSDAQLRMLSDWIEGGLYCDTSQSPCGTH